MGCSDRRAFLQLAAAVAAEAAICVAGKNYGSALAAQSAKAESAESGDARGQKLLVGCRDGHLRLAGAADCWQAMKTLGAECVEAVIDDRLSLPGLFHPQQKYSAATKADIDRLRADMHSAGLRISALCMYNRFDERPDFELDWCARAAKAAAAIGVPAIRVDLVPRKVARKDYLQFSIDMMQKVIRATEDTGVTFGIENHGNTTNDPEFLQALFDKVSSPRLGLTLDTGNFYWFGHPLAKVYEIFQKFAHRAVHTHCKSINYPEAQRQQQRPMGWEYGKYTCPIDQGDIDFSRLLKTLLDAGYRNDLCVENESLGRFPVEQRAEIVAREIRFLKKLRQ